MTLLEEYYKCLDQELLKKKQDIIFFYNEISTGRANPYARYYSGRLQANFTFGDRQATSLEPVLGTHNRRYGQGSRTLNTGIPRGSNEGIRTSRESLTVVTILSHDFRKEPLRFTNLLSKSGNPRINYYLEGGGASEATLTALLRQHLL